MAIERLNIIRSRSNTPEPYVLVIGAGIAGSMAALELSNKGIPVRLVERRNLTNGYRGNERSEMTLSGPIKALGAENSITTYLNAVQFISLGNGKEFAHTLPTANPEDEHFAVAVNHHQLVNHLHGAVGKRKNIEFQYSTSVANLSENGDGVHVTFKDGETEFVKAVVNASGPAWNSLHFPNLKRQEQYQKSIVAIVYGKRCRGRILRDGGEHMMMHPVSVQTGRTSWVNSSGDGLIEVIYSDYATRDNVGKTDRQHKFNMLKRRLIEMGLIEIEEEGPTISGFFGLEPARHAPGSTNIFFHGEKGGYNSATVGDAISPTYTLSRQLAHVIATGGNATDYHQHTQSIFPHKLELAMTKTRMSAKTLGNALSLFEIVKEMTPSKQKEFLYTHKIPFQKIPKLILKHPELIFTIKEIVKQYLKICFSR